MSEHFKPALAERKEKEVSQSAEGVSVAPPSFQMEAGSAAPVAGGGNSAVPAIQAKTAEPQPFQLKEDSSSESEGQSLSPVQRKEGDADGGGDDEGGNTALGEYKGIAIDVAKSKAVDMAWDYWDQLKEEYSLTDHVAELLERAAMYLIDYGVRITGIGAYLTAMNPYLEILKAVKTIIETIPAPIRVFLGYAIGYGIKKFSDKCMWGAIKEKHLNFLLIEGGDAAAILGQVIDFLYDLGHNPVQTIYKGIWAAVRYFTGNDDIDSMTDYLNHLEDGAKESTGYSGLNGPEGEGKEGGGKEEQLTAQEKAQQDNLFNTDLGFFWVRMGMPKLDRWDDEESGEERGGMVIDAGLGVKLFGNAMGSDDVEFKLPYSTDWSMTFRDTVLLQDPISLGNWFRGGPVNMPLLKLKSGVGVSEMELQLLDFVFGNDTFIAKELGMRYSASDEMLAFSGDTVMNVFGHTILGRFNLDVGTDGEFKGGYVDVVLPEQLDIIKDKLALSNLNFIGKWGEEGLELLELAGDIHANAFGKLDFDATRTAVRWQNGEFVGSVNQMSVLVPLGSNSFVELILDSGEISKEGFSADKITLKFSYGDQETQEENEERLRNGQETPKIQQSDIQSIIPGFNMDWIQHTGLDTLVVSASANGISLGADGFEMDGDLEKKLHKLAAEVLGVKATFDGDKNEGSLEGKWNYKVPNLPSVGFDFPIIPGINAGVGIGAELEMGANLDGSLRKLPHAKEGSKTPWELGGHAGLFGKANVRAHFDVSAGHPLLVSIHAGLFGEAGAEMAADAALYGQVNWDEDAHRISLHDDPKKKPSASFDMHADLNATLGAHIKARAFHIFQVTLWEYKFVEWNMGIWRAKGRMEAKEDGGYDFSFEQAAFDGGRPFRKPEIEFKVARTEDVILERERNSDEIDDKLLFWRLVHDVMDPTQPMSQATRMVMMEKLKRLNDTGKPWEYYTGQTGDSMEERLAGDSSGVSFLMEREEFEQYSRVRGWFGEKKRKKHDRRVDNILDRYHGERDLSRKKDILINLVDNVLPLYLHEGHSRDAMMAKLLADAKRELRRIEGLIASEPTESQDPMGQEASGWGSGGGTR